jgi:hypothetical protein
LDYAREFYRDPKNQKAFEEWLANGKPFIKPKLPELKKNKRKMKK